MKKTETRQTESERFNSRFFSIRCPKIEIASLWQSTCECSRQWKGNGLMSDLTGSLYFYTGWISVDQPTRIDPWRFSESISNRNLIDLVVFADRNLFCQCSFCSSECFLKAHLCYFTQGRPLLAPLLHRSMLSFVTPHGNIPVFWTNTREQHALSTNQSGTIPNL